jgi:molecular chaperone Hsp33
MTVILDKAQGFVLPERHARGRLVRLGPVLNEILAAHNYPPPIERLLAEALVLTGLLGAMLKDRGGQLTVQAQTQQGVANLLVCDYQDGALRGYVQFDPEKLALYGKNPSLRTLLGTGYLAITFDQQTSGERYQGIVPLDAPSLGEAAEQYFSQSEQIPSMMRIAVRHDPGEACVAGGLLLQHLPEGEEGRERIHTQLDHPEWEHVAILGGTVKPEELTDFGLDYETLVWRLFNEEAEIRMLEAVALSKGCRCSIEHFASVISSFPVEERAQMVGEDGKISVDCAFCARIFAIPAVHGTA